MADRINTFNSGLILPTSIIYEPAVVASHGVLLLDHTDKISLQYGHIQILGSIKVPLGLEQFLRAVAHQESCSVLLGLHDVVRLKSDKDTTRVSGEPPASSAQVRAGGGV